MGNAGLLFSEVGKEGIEAGVEIDGLELEGAEEAPMEQDKQKAEKDTMAFKPAGKAEAMAVGFSSARILANLQHIQKL